MPCFLYKNIPRPRCFGPWTCVSSNESFDTSCKLLGKVINSSRVQFDAASQSVHNIVRSIFIRYKTVMDMCSKRRNRIWQNKQISTKKVPNFLSSWWWSIIKKYKLFLIIPFQSVLRSEWPTLRCRLESNYIIQLLTTRWLTEVWPKHDDAIEPKEIPWQIRINLFSASW